VESRDRNLTILMGVLLGASLGAMVALILVRRSREGAKLSLREVSWRDLMKLIGPIFAVGRQLLEMSRREISKPDML
jgi:hypothetical protein